MLPLTRRHALTAAGAAFLVGAAPARPSYRWPERFLWGTATAGHQIDGGNTNSDYWLLENLPNTRFKERSGDTCDSWNRWPEDIGLLKALGVNAYRFSVEWARIEPEPDLWSQATLDHYRRQCAALRDAGIMPVVTLHHFTSPRWIGAMGGWENEQTADRFARYAERVAAALGDLTGAFCTLNEPNAQVNSQVLRGGKADPKDAPILAAAARKAGSDRFGAYFLGDAFKVRDICIKAHRKGVDAVKAKAPGTKVGITLALQEWKKSPGGDALYERLWQQARKPFYDAAKGDDFIGVQTYILFRTGPDGFLPARQDAAFINTSNLEVPPTALGAAVREAHANTGAPVFVTENGIETEDDALRMRHLSQSLDSLHDAIADDVPVLGYMHWSLMDNFEWESGYGPKFGLYSVDRATFARKSKPAAALFRDLIRKAGVKPVSGKL